MADTYVRLDSVFTQTQANPAWFFLISLVVALVATILFQKTRQMWADGPRGGATFALWLGLIVGFNQFFLPLVVEGFPYYLAWCWLGIDVIAFCVLGAVIGQFIRRE
jgi:glycopeptide antibiotics resistance protein